MPDEPVVPEVPETPPETPPVADAPWSSDLAGYVVDPAERANADRYLREKWQPHVTKLEQDLASARPGVALHNDFVNDPDNTFVAVAQELWGDDAHDKLQELFASQNPETPPPAANEPPPQDPRVTAMVEAYEVSEQQRQYQDLLTQTKTANPDVEIVDALFHPFVIAADGDFSEAVPTYQAWLTEARSHLGSPPPPSTPPPSTLGSDTPGGPPPPVQPRYATIDEALDATLDEMRSSRQPAPVGVV